MRKGILLGFLMMLTGCSATHFAYPHSNNEFTVLASSPKAQMSDDQAYQLASEVCAKQGLYPQVNRTDRIPNSVDRITIDGQTVYLTSYFQAHDYMTMMQITCAQKEQSRAR